MLSVQALRTRLWHRLEIPPFPMMSKAVAAGLLIGVSAGIWAPQLLPEWLRWLLLVVGASLWIRSRRLGWLGALLLGLGWVNLQAGSVLAAQLPPALEGKEVPVSGQISGLPEMEARRTRFRLRVDDIPENPEPLRGRLLQLAWYDDFGAVEPGPRTALHAGAKWQMSIRVRAPRGLINPGGFDAERHALAQRITATGYVRSTSAPRQLRAPRGIDAWRERMALRIFAVTPATSSRYVQALALGDTRALADEDWHTLRATGLTHLIAISGFHVGLVAGFFALATAGIWRVVPLLAHHWPRPQAAASAALMGAIFYAAVAGFALPTVRTVLMIAVVVLARLWRRPTGVAGSLALAAIVVLLCDPLSILAAGFWLSFAGVAWLVWCLPDSRIHWLRGFFSAQGVATLGLLPLTVVLFGQASLAGPLANLVAIPWWSLVVVPLALLGTGLEALVAGSGAWLWQLSGWCFDLSWPLFEWLGHSRFSLWWLPESGRLALLLALLGAFWLLLPRAVPGKTLALLLWLPMLWPARELPARGEVELLLVDVGQGLAVLVRTARHSVLYDAGPAVKDGFDAGERAVVPALRALGVSQLDRVVISHGDSDHIGGFNAVRASIPVAEWRAPEGMQPAADMPCLADQQWEWDGVVFRFLHPTPAFPYLRNESSCVLQVQSRHGTLLLTGDIGEVIEQGLVKRRAGDLRADVVIAPHHGSAGSSQAAFVGATGARLVLVSSGHGNRFGHPRAEVVQRWQTAGAEVLATADSGAIRVWLGEDGVQLRERRRSRPRIWDAAERARSAAILSAMKRAADVPEG